MVCGCGHVVPVLDAGNQKNMLTIQNALFLLALDQNNPGLPTQGEPPNRSQFIDEGRTRLAERGIHGCGTHANSANRWFDKTLQVCTSIINSKNWITVTSGLATSYLKRLFATLASSYSCLYISLKHLCCMAFISIFVVSIPRATDVNYYATPSLSRFFSDGAL